MILPAAYSRIPLPPPPGSLGEAFADNQDGLQMNLTAIQTSLRQINVALAALDKASSGAAAKAKSLEVLLGAYVKLTAASGGSTWGPSDYAGAGTVIIDPNGESNTLNLPTPGANSQVRLTVKCLANSGNVLITSGSGNIVTSAAPGASVLSIPYTLVADGVNFTPYAVTLLWTGTEWNVIDTAILIV